MDVQSSVSSLANSTPHNKCPICGFSGPYVGACPQCGSPAPKDSFGKKPPHKGKIIAAISVAVVLLTMCMFFWITSTKEIMFSEHNLTLTVGDTLILSAQISPSYALNHEFSYSSSDETVACVNGTQIIALRAGTAVISVLQGGKIYDECLVTVNHLQPYKIFFSSETLTAYIGRNMDLSVSLIPSNATDTELLYQVTDTSIARINGTTLEGLQAGTVVVTAIHQSTGLSCEATVQIVPVEPDSLRIVGAESVYLGETLTMDVEFSPNDVTDPTVCWTSSNPSVLFVEDATIIANDLGTAVLTATHSSGKTAEITITVQPVLPRTVSLSSQNGNNLLVKDTTIITPTVLPENTTDKTIHWSSSDTTVATVDKNGKVTAKNPGKVHITAELCNGVSSYLEFTINPQPVIQKNGLVKNPSVAKEAPVTIHAPKDESCYVYFQSLTSRDKDFSVFAAAGTTAEVDAPLGKYALYYATGKTWYGREYKFGVGTGYYTTSDTFSFYTSGNYVYGTELTLYAVVNGNMSTYEIPEERFPD